MITLTYSNLQVDYINKATIQRKQ